MEKEEKMEMSWAGWDRQSYAKHYEKTRWNEETDDKRRMAEKQWRYIFRDERLDEMLDDGRQWKETMGKGKSWMDSLDLSFLSVSLLFSFGLSFDILIWV